MENQNNKLMAILAYLGPLVIVSYLVAKDQPFVKFHIKQGLVLLIIHLIVWMLMMGMYGLWPIIRLVNLATLVLAIIGIVNVTKNQEKELPLVGQFAKHFRI